MRKWAGVRAISSSTSLPTKVNGRSFTRASTSHKTVRNSSGAAKHWPNVAFNAVFTDRTRRSQYPPHQGARSVMNIHSTRSDARCRCTVSQFRPLKRCFKKAFA
ncbi:hypothetical protein T07_12980 [Trichinella nelsoni]|uniref:Uncharacterized protein n=1 Tax=Trichinella nelsoni TaxID=6336 RepID=A0A0V0RN46_9BILA|nr:hypothetical protein T07_12980 [Trichinella nelsoni]